MEPEDLKPGLKIQRTSPGYVARSTGTVIAVNKTDAQTYVWIEVDLFADSANKSQYIYSADYLCKWWGEVPTFFSIGKEYRRLRDPLVTYRILDLLHAESPIDPMFGGVATALATNSKGEQWFKMLNLNDFNGMELVE